MDLVLPPHPDIEIKRNQFYHSLYSKFESLLYLYILNTIDQELIEKKQNEIRQLFNSLIIELKLLNENNNGILEPLLVNFIKSDEPCIVGYLLKLLKLDIDKKLKTHKSDNIDNCAQFYKEYICTLLNHDEW